MNRVVLKWMDRITSEREFQEPIVEFGAFQVEGQEDVADMRRYFPGKEYIGCDLEKGSGVDRIENIEHSTFPPGSIGTVLALETLEHVRQPWEAAREIFRMLKPGGTALISIPFNFAIHCHPDDYWRMTASGLTALLESAGFRDIEASDSGEDTELDLFWDRPEDRPTDQDFPVTETRHFPYTCFAVATKPLADAGKAGECAPMPLLPTRPLLEVTPTGEYTQAIPIIMVLFHREEDTREVLEQIERVTENYSLILVDNGFDDPAYVEGLGAAGYLKNTKNVGIPKAINQGLELAKGDYIAVMHNDLFIYDEGWLQHIIEFMERRPDVGIVGLAGRHTIRRDGSLDEETLVVTLPEYWEVYGPSWRFTEVAAIDGICFVMRNIGLRLDESMGPLHYYDLDISMQYARAGYRLYCARVECFHGREEYLREGGAKAALTTGIDTDEEFLAARERFVSKWGDNLPITRGFVDEQYFYQRHEDLYDRLWSLTEDYRKLEDYAENVLQVECHEMSAEIERAKEYVTLLEREHAKQVESIERYESAYAELENRFLTLARSIEAEPGGTRAEPGGSGLEKLGYYIRTEGLGATLKRAVRRVFRRWNRPECEYIPEVTDIEQSMVRPRRHVIITGTGRAGTTFLVQLLTALGLDTGFHEGNLVLDENARAGLEWDIREEGAPYVIKNPWFCDYAEEVLARDDIVIEHVFIPMRDLEAAAESRRYVVETAVSKGREPTGLLGGLWHTDTGSEQEAVLLNQIYKLVYALSDSAVPVTLMRYPRFMKDASYLYRKLEPILGDISFDRFEEAFRRTVKPEIMHSFTEGDR
ncbi:MAG: glycosyltransferase [Actinobacteria bacterium]|nr:glycosyltransferase [Actinomycetota bacterium]MBU1942317.1 glycosyltransferase [Actinomycetota bacterium]MBU2686873.1 glycosyltransferase [Actinomycetota bacterium]